MKVGKDNKLAEKHGGASAEKAIYHEKPFSGLAQVRQQEVIEELQDQGVDKIIERNAIRLQTAADLYFEALKKAAQDGDEKRFDSYVGRFGWLTAKTLLAWGNVKQSHKENKGRIAEVLTFYAEGDEAPAAQDTAIQPQEGQEGQE